jgi:hypothetical protein
VDGPGAAVGSPADIDDADLRAADLIGEPVRRREELRSEQAGHRARWFRASVGG